MEYMPVNICINKGLDALDDPVPLTKEEIENLFTGRRITREEYELYFNNNPNAKYYFYDLKEQFVQAINAFQIPGVLDRMTNIINNTNVQSSFLGNMPYQPLVMNQPGFGYSGSNSQFPQANQWNTNNLQSPSQWNPLSNQIPMNQSLPYSSSSYSPYGNAPQWSAPNEMSMNSSPLNAPLAYSQPYPASGYWSASRK